MNTTNFQRFIHGQVVLLCRGGTLSALTLLLAWGWSTPSTGQTTVKDIVEQSRLEQQSKTSSESTSNITRMRQAQRPGNSVQRVQPIPSQNNPNQNAPATQQSGEPGNPNRPMNQGTSLEPISVDYVDAPLSEVVKSIGAHTGRNFLLDPTISNQKVTIISHHKIPPDLAFEFLETVLTFQNFEVVEALDGNLVRIGPRNLSGNDKLPIYKGNNLPHPGYDNRAIHIVQVQYASAEEISQLLQTVGSQNAEITVFQYTNTLIIKDTADGVRNMFAILKSVDIPGYDINVEIFPLEYTRAEALAQQLEQVLIVDGSGGGSAQRQPARPTQVRTSRSAATPNQPTNVVVGSSDDTLRMVPDERLNALIVVATTTQMDQVRALIKQLDTPTPFEMETMHHVALQNAEAEDLVPLLEAITGTEPRQGSDQAQTGAIQPFEKEVIIEAYEPTNSLVIVASPQDFDKLMGIINELDIPQKQVAIEVIIMEVAISDGYELSVEAAAADEEHWFGFSNAINIANAIATGPASLAGAGGTIGILDGTTEISDGQGGTMTVPNVPFLIRALEVVTDVDVLSKPNLLTTDNKESRIHVGQEIPVLTSQGDVNPQSGFQSRNNIERLDVGITLIVTPQVNEGDNISMDIQVESSTPVTSTVGIDPNETGATIQIAEIENEVQLKNGQTGIIGGLIREGRNEGVSQVPWLGDIPLIGSLFRSRRNGREKQNLVVLLTPQIIKQDDELQDITDSRLEEFYEQNLDVIFEQDRYIKKTKLKHELRKNYRPSNQFNPNKTNIQDYILDDEDGSGN